MKVEVTQEHIKEGTKQSGCFCPIALAISPYNKTKLFVYGSCLGFPEARGEIAQLPSEAIQFIGLFDSSQPVSPFSFNLSAECFMV